MGRLFDCEKEFRSGLAFFPVVAISTNFSTKIFDTKQVKIFRKTKKNLSGCKVPEYFLKITLLLLKGKYCIPVIYREPEY